MAEGSLRAVLVCELGADQALDLARDRLRFLRGRDSVAVVLDLHEPQSHARFQ